MFNAKIGNIEWIKIEGGAAGFLFQRINNS